ncbi:WXG100 family type VII secretion target [Mycobacterium sp. NPDC050853]|uniref:WXG100 family type VII secretion target n=1 Tax=Mycobacterium sp. NPDC050853 TaxID=3155160 RepID=UPI0033CF50F1
MGVASGASEFHVEPDKLMTVVTLLTTFEKAAEAFIADVDKRVHDMHIEFEGATAAAHLEAHQKWAKGAAEMREAVAVLNKVVTGAHGNYTAAISTNTKMWQRG